MVKWDFKKTEWGVPPMLAPRRHCLGYSNFYCYVRKRWLLAWNQNRHIMHYIFHFANTNSEISIGLLYIHPRFVWWHWLNHCATLVRNLPTSNLVRAKVSLLTFHTSTIWPPLGFTDFERWSCQTTSKILNSSLKKKISVSIKNQINIVR